MKKDIIKKLGKLLLVINTTLFVISFSIACVILFRPFYYYQIDYLNIEESSGYSKEVIKEAYDDVLDYLTFKGEFKTGELKYTSEGMSHFKDCKILFLIDFIVLGITSVVTIIKMKKFNNIRLLNFSTYFWSGISIIFIFLSIIIPALIVGFNKAFEIFHNIFFLGKDNWILDPDADEIINILPKEYFLNCVILVISIMFIISISFIVKGIYDNIKMKKGGDLTCQKKKKQKDLIL